MVGKKLNSELEQDLIIALIDWGIKREICVFDPEYAGYISICSSRKISLLREISEKIIHKVEECSLKNKTPSSF